MHSPSIVDYVFGQFQNLNLVVLMEDLRRGLIARGNWSSELSLCPVSHGVSDGDTVRLLGYASQAVDLKRACQIAAHDLRTSAFAILQFVELWDSAWFGHEWLLGQLEKIWAERLADADAVQCVLEPRAEPIERRKMAGVYGNRTHLGPDFQTLRRV